MPYRHETGTRRTWTTRTTRINTEICPCSPRYPRRPRPMSGRSLYPIFNLRNRRLLLTTNTLLNAIAPAANIGFKYPSAAAGIRMTL